MNTIDTSLNLPASSGARLLSGRIKSVPADFVVQEALDFEFDGQGEHLYLYVRKCGMNTNDVVDVLQQQFGCSSVDIGVSGLKDKQAVTDQWFSIRTSKELSVTNLPRLKLPVSLSASVDNIEAISTGDLQVLESHRHSRKLRRGAHCHNRFTITIRDIVSENRHGSLRDEVDKRLHLLQANGFANYYGPQRFGHGYQNIAAANRLFANPKRKMSRNKRSLLLSAARSQIFNSVCAERVRARNWNLPLSGEPMVLNGTHSFFINDTQAIGNSSLQANNAAVQSTNTVARCERHDIHPSGPLWGRGGTLAKAECEQFEANIVQVYANTCEGLENAGLKQQRRALRANVECLQWHWDDLSIVTLEFNLLKGVYATSFLSEFMINL